MIRLATKNDLEIIVKNNEGLAFETEGITLNQARLRQGVMELLTDPAKGRYYVYEDNNHVVGQIMITTEWSDWRNANIWWIQSVYVQKNYRQKGIFQALYNYINDLSEHNACGLRLYVDRNNVEAQSAYKKVKMVESHYLLYEKKAD